MTAGAVAGKPQVIVAGAGPVGLLTALALAARDIRVLVLEAEPDLTIDLRAGTYHPPSLEMMAPYGITDEMHKTAIRVPRWQIRDRKEGVIVEWDVSEISDLTPYPYRLHLEQHRLTPIIYSKLSAYPNAEVRFSHEVTDVEQNADRVVVTAKTPGGTEKFEAPWVVGADGGRSTVRKCVGLEFEGFTWPERFVVVSTTDDYATHGYAMNAYVSDPEEWVAVFKMPDDGPPGMWRVIFPVPEDEEEEITLSEQWVERRMQGFIPRSGRYPIKYKSIYKVHQRVAKDFRCGRVLLAGDAAHLNNPMGAFGLNGGIHDSFNLTDKLGRICRGEADPGLLDLYVRQRRTVNLEYVQEFSIRNLKRLNEKDERERQKNFAELRQQAKTPEGRREFLRISSMLASVQRANAIR
jgi:3-(3-hydroxy-phenyl)propionate hydroxylase